MGTPSTALIEKRNELDAKRDAVAKATTKAKNANGTYDDAILAKELGVKPEELEGELTKRRREMNDLGTQVEAMAIAEDAKRWSGDDTTPLPTGTKREEQVERKSIGQLFVESEAYAKRGKSGAMGPAVEVKLDQRALLKTLFSTSAGWAPESTRTGVVIYDAQRPPQVLDFIPQIPTKQAAVKFMEETTFTNNAVEKAEGAAAGENVFALTEQSQTVETLPVSIPTTEQQLEDVEEVEAYLNNRLEFSLRQRLDGQVLVGNGTTPNLAGITDNSDIQTQALGSETHLDAIHKALTKARVTGRSFPNAAMFHSTDWQTILLASKTADGVYILGNPADAQPQRVWGLPVIQTEGLTQGTALVGDFRNFCALYVKRDVTFLVGYVNDDLTKLRRTIVAYLRAAMVTYRGAAFCTITGL